MSSELPRIYIDGKPERDGRSVRREDDDGYSAYDLTEAQLGDRVTLLTATGAHDFVKDTDREGALYGWRRADGERALGVALKTSVNGA